MTNSIKCLLAISIFGICSAAYGQASITDITVRDEHGRPVKGATIKSESGFFDGTTDATGSVHYNQKNTETTRVVHEDPNFYTDESGVIHEGNARYPFEGVPINEPRHTETVEEGHIREAAEKAKSEERMANSQKMLEEMRRNSALLRSPAAVKKAGF